MGNDRTLLIISSTCLIEKCVVEIRTATVIICPFQVDGVRSNTEGKLQLVLEQVKSPASQARYCGGRKCFWPRPRSTPDYELAEAVNFGRTTLVLPATAAALERLLAFLERHRINNIMLTLDEGDAIFPTPVTWEEAESDVVVPLKNLREAYMYRLLGRMPLGKGSLVRSVLSVSPGGQVWKEGGSVNV